jgi:sialidase-1
MEFFSTVWKREDSPYANNRIPGMIVTARGTLILYNEAREKGGDWAHMDIFMQRSEDFGRTFGEPIYLARGNDRFKTVNNPVMAEDQNGVLHFLHCEDYSIRGGRVLHRISTDDGLTWSEPQDITRMTLPLYRNAFALGPGHGICTKDGTLIFPIWMVPKCYEQEITSHVPSCISTLYSRDCGMSWQMGEILIGNSEAVSPNETTVTPTSDGRIYLNARVNKHHCRAVSYSQNGYRGWSPLTLDRSLTDPCCFGSSVTVETDGRTAILFANCDSESDRKNVTVRVSFDDGKTFSHKKVIDPDRGGYVEIAADQRNGLVYILYEENWGKSCHLCVMDFATLLS